MTGRGGQQEQSPDGARPPRSGYDVDDGCRHRWLVAARERGAEEVQMHVGPSGR